MMLKINVHILTRELIWKKMNHSLRLVLLRKGAYFFKGA